MQTQEAFLKLLRDYIAYQHHLVNLKKSQLPINSLIQSATTGITTGNTKKPPRATDQAHSANEQKPDAGRKGTGKRNPSLTPSDAGRTPPGTIDTSKVMCKGNVPLSKCCYYHYEKQFANGRGCRFEDKAERCNYRHDVDVGEANFKKMTRPVARTRDDSVEPKGKGRGKGKGKDGGKGKGKSRTPSPARDDAKSTADETSNAGGTPVGSDAEGGKKTKKVRKRAKDKKEKKEE